MIFFRLIFFLNLLCFNSLQAAEFKGKFEQGSFILGKTNSSAKVKIDNKNVRVSKDGYFAFGISKDRKYDIVITEGKNKIVKKIEKRKYKIQKIDGLPKKKSYPTKRSL